jgi:hypothetical protein
MRPSKVIVDTDSKAVRKGSCRLANLHQPCSLRSACTGPHFSEIGKTPRCVQPITIGRQQREREKRPGKADAAEVFRPDRIPFKETGDRPRGGTKALSGHEASDPSAPPTPSATNDAPVESKSARIVDAPRQFLLRLFVSKQQRIELSLRRGIPRRQRSDGSLVAVKWNQYEAK